ncbi:aminodeoxychorismate lyase [Marinicella sp. W31]|uniref:aminodeoxychorismate lyase n=1 Tax=Marinicella sp. W31 TaxID=3023713 RepID=UPI003758097B
MSTYSRSSYSHLDAFNRAASYGDGVFETIRCVHGRMPLWSYHHQRLCRGLERLQIESPEASEINAAIDELLDDTSTGVVKLMVFRAGAARGYSTETQANEWQLRFTPTETLVSPEPMRVSIANVKLAPQPLLAGIKHLNRLEQVLAGLELAKHHSDDLIMCDVMDNIIESISSNLIMIKDEQMITPDLSDCGVQGVGLRWLQTHLSIKTRTIALEELCEAESIVLINSVRGPRLVSEVKGMKSYGQSHPLQAKMRHLWDQLFT